MYRAAREFDEPDVPPETMLDVVFDVAAYPEFVRGVQGAKILQRDGSILMVEMTAGVAGMDFVYVLKVERLENEVCWHRVKGAFKHAEGRMAWLGGARYRYEQALDLGFAVPQFAVRFVLEGNLPRLIRGYRDRAKKVLAERGGA